jgi:hypothetical protein
MSADKFSFVSPGVLVDEIDNTGLQNQGGNPVGPVVIGRTRRGPSRPVQVKSFSEYIEVFGEPVPGGEVSDVWREGNYTSPMYATYAAQAWLTNKSPLTVVRVLGEQSDNAQEAGKAGWQTINSLDSDETANGGAFALFMIDSGSATSNLTGTIAAVFYLQEGSIVLSGSNREGTAQVTGSATLIKSTGSDREFKAMIYDDGGNLVENTTFNFNKSSQKYIRKVFNTNPILTNSDIVSAGNLKTYWLGESYDRHLTSYVTSSNAGSQFGAILALEGSHAGNVGGHYYRYPSQNGKTGWVFSQDISDNTGSFEPRDMPKLFRFHSLYGGEWDSKNIKISIQDIKISNRQDSDYGSFTVVVRLANDSDAAPRVVERFSGVNLNPASSNFIARVIGDREMVWDDIEKRYKEYGIYQNNSQYVRIEVSPEVMNGMLNPILLPFGFYGQVRHKGFSVLSGSTSEGLFNNVDTAYTASFVKGATDLPRSNAEGTEFLNVGTIDFTGSFVFPAMPLRLDGAAGNLSSPKQVFYGVDVAQSAGSTLFNKEYRDLVRPLAGDYSAIDGEGEYTEFSYMFTLDDLSGSSVTNNIATPALYVSGSRAAGTSFSAVQSDGWRDVLNNDHNRFTMPIVGGFDGYDITEKDPFRNNAINSSPTEENDYVFYSLKRAIDSVADPDVVEYDLVVMPGITQEGLTGHLTDVSTARADSLAIIDPLGAYVPQHENTLSFASRVGDVSTIVNNMRNRGIDTSYGTAYDPWVMVRDSRSGQQLMMPPSVVALGTMASSDKKADLWFAPSGFTRGGLTLGASGLNVVGVERKLSKPDRDKLYEANINPIAKFPAEGIVIYGQKTLQKTPSALDRINVRRLLNFVKREISVIAKTTLFEPNIIVTWENFLSRAEPVLDDIKSKFGLLDYKIILDETTTTPDLVDRNIMYAKIFLKPTRSIEFIGLDFILEPSGATFQ